MEWQNKRYGPVMTVGDWIGTFLLSGIPIVGFILLIVWAFDSSTNVNKKNFARAVLLLAAIAVGVWLFFVLIIGSLVSLSSRSFLY